METMFRAAYQKFNASLSGPHVLLNELVVPRVARALQNEPKPYEKLRIAFVKQEVTPGFYCTPPDASPRELLETCFKHLGPLALSTRLHAHFPIVKTTNDLETQVWKEVVTDAHLGKLEDYESLKTRPFLGGKRGHQHAPGHFAVDPREVDWSRYDVVISANIAVPTEVVKKFPGTTWAYFCDPPVTTHYRRSRKGPVYGYDLFLNLRYRTCRILPTPNPWHVIDWPFDILCSGSLSEALGEPLPAERSGVYVEHHSLKLLTPAQRERLASFGPIYEIQARTIDIVRDLLKAKYYVRLGGRLLWGNAQIEGIAAGCLFLADPHEFLNKSLFTKATAVHNFDELMVRLEEFERNPTLYGQELAKQEALLDYFCYHRPLSELWEKHCQIQSRRTT